MSAIRAVDLRSARPPVDRGEPTSPDVFDVVAEKLRREDVAKALEALPPREQMVLRMRFGFEDGEPLSRKAIGLELGVTRERVRQIERQALNRLSLLHELAKANAVAPPPAPARPWSSLEDAYAKRENRRDKSWPGRGSFSMNGDVLRDGFVKLTVDILCVNEGIARRVAEAAAEALDRIESELRTEADEK